MRERRVGSGVGSPRHPVLVGPDAYGGEKGGPWTMTMAKCVGLAIGLAFVLGSVGAGSVAAEPDLASVSQTEGTATHIGTYARLRAVRIAAVVCA